MNVLPIVTNNRSIIARNKKNKLSRKGYKMERQKSEVDLAAPSLNAIYNSQELLEENNDSDVYKEIKNATKDHEKAEEKPIKANSLLRVIINILILGICGVIFSNFTENIGSNESWFFNVAHKPFVISGSLIEQISHIKGLPTGVVGFIWGIIFGVIQPVCDKLSQKVWGSSGSSGSKENTISSSRKSRKHSFSSIVRSTVVLLGVSFGLRHVNWQSPLQASIAFCLLNPCVWLLLDGTVSGFICCTFFGTITTISAIVFDDSNSIKGLNQIMEMRLGDEQLAMVLLTGSFFFSLLIVFGKLGRFLW